MTTFAERLGKARRRYVVALVTSLLITSLWMAPAAQAFIFVVPSVSFPGTVTVGQTFPAGIGIGNFSTPPESTAHPVMPMTEIDLIPACAIAVLDCLLGVEAGVFQLSATGTGAMPSPPSCLGTWTITEIAPGRYRFTPPGGEGSLQLATGEVCVVGFTATALRVPTTDLQPATPGTQTTQLASAAASPPGLPPVRNSGSDFTTVLEATPGTTTTTRPPSITVPGTTPGTTPGATPGATPGTTPGTTPPTTIAPGVLSSGPTRVPTLARTGAYILSAVGFAALATVVGFHVVVLARRRDDRQG